MSICSLVVGKMPLSKSTSSYKMSHRTSIAESGWILRLTPVLDVLGRTITGQAIVNTLLSCFRLSRLKEEQWESMLQSICGDPFLAVTQRAIRLQMESLSGTLTMTATLASVISANLQAGNSQLSSSITVQSPSVELVWIETGNLNDSMFLQK